MCTLWRSYAECGLADIVIPSRVGIAAEAGFRFFIHCAFGVGVVYAMLASNALRSYGFEIDEKGANLERFNQGRFQVDVLPKNNDS